MHDPHSMIQPLEPTCDRVCECLRNTLHDSVPTWLICSMRLIRFPSVATKGARPSAPSGRLGKHERPNPRTACLRPPGTVSLILPIPFSARSSRCQNGMEFSEAED